MPITPEEIEKRFTHHPPHGTQVERYQDLRKAGELFAKVIVLLTPDCREQALAVTHLEEVVMWANAAIARREP